MTRLPSPSALLLLGAAFALGCDQTDHFPPLAGAPQALRDPWSHPERYANGFQIALDDTHAYWTTLGLGEVRRAPKEGGPYQALNTPVDDRYPAGLALDATRVYFGANYTGELLSVPKDGGAEDVLRPQTSTLQGMFSVAVDEGWVYTAELNDWQVRRTPAGGGPTVALSLPSYGATSIAVDETHVYWAMEGAEDAATSRIMGVPKAGGVEEVLARDIDFRPFVAIDDDHVYWVTADTCRVQRVAKTGGPVSTLSEARRGHCYTIAVDGEHVYWASALDGDDPAGIWRVPKDGGERASVVEVSNIYGIALDDQHLYYPSEVSAHRVAK